jgi:hypothetical protein
MSRNSASASGVGSERKAGESLPGALEQGAANERWPQEHAHRLVHSDSILGIAAPDSHSLSLMRTRLRELAAGLESNLSNAIKSYCTGSLL